LNLNAVVNTVGIVKTCFFVRPGVFNGEPPDLFRLQNTDRDATIASAMD
jgi:hypothetical protein